MAKPRDKNDGRGRLGGRAKGTPNKITVDAKAVIKDIVNDNAEEARKKLSLIADPKDWLDMYIKLCSFVLPKLSAVQVDADVKQSDLKSELEELSKTEIEG